MKKKKEKEKDPKLSLGWRRIFFASWLGDGRISNLARGGLLLLGHGLRLDQLKLLCLGSSFLASISLWALGLWQSFSFLTFALILWPLPLATSTP